MSDVYVCIYKKANMQARLGGGGGVLTQEIFLEIKCSEISSGAISGHSSCYFWLGMHFISQISTREGTKVGRTVDGMTSRKGQLVNSRAPDIAIIYAHNYAIDCIYDYAQP